MINRIIIFDTSIYIDHLRTNKFKKHFENLVGLIRNTSVVLSELHRGAVKKEERNFISVLSKNHPVLTPTNKNWLESGRLLSKIKKDHGFSPEKIRDLLRDN